MPFSGKVLGVLRPFFQEGSKQGLGQRPKVFPVSHPTLLQALCGADDVADAGEDLGGAVSVGAEGFGR